MTNKHVSDAHVGFIAIADEDPRFFVTAFDPVFGARLIVAEFKWDDDSPDAKHHRDEAERLANLLAHNIGWGDIADEEARLSRSGPELLNALKAIARSDTFNGGTFVKELQHIAKEAIAKVEGA